MAYVSTLGSSSHSLLSVCQRLHRKWGQSIALAFFAYCEEELCSVSDIWTVIVKPNEIAAVWICCDHRSLIDAIQVEHNGALCYLHHSLILGTVQRWESLWRPWIKLHQVPKGTIPRAVPVCLMDLLASTAVLLRSSAAQFAMSCSLPQHVIFFILYKRPKLSSLHNCLSLRPNL